jgi:hypothetical protein
MLLVSEHIWESLIEIRAIAGGINQKRDVNTKPINITY